MNTTPYWNKKVCSDCKRMKCQKGCLCDCHQFLMLFKNILVPYGGSSHSKHAFKVALDMVKKYNSKISMVNVLDISSRHWGNSKLWDKAMSGAKNRITKD